MHRFAILRLAIVASLSCALVGCLTAPATTEGSGYQVTRFSNAEAARLASQDVTAGPAIHSNNQQCVKDPACRK